MHIPKTFEITDYKIIEQFIKENGFATLITNGSAFPTGTHIPLELEENEKSEKILAGHISKANPQWQEFENKTNLPAQKIIDYVRSCGGVCIPAHPFRFKAASIGDKLETLIGIFAIEGYNAKSDIEENRMAWEKAEKLNLKLTGGSDAHVVGQIGKCVTEFPSNIENMSELVEALKSGNFQAKYLF